MIFSPLARFRLALCALLSVPLFVVGCDNPIAGKVAGKIFRAPNKTPKNGLEFSRDVQDVARKAYAETFSVNVQGAVLRVGVVEPGEYSFQWTPKINGKNVWVEGPIKLSVTRTDAPAKGLLIMLHGFGCCKEQMLPWALELASAGYRVALVDLRGHGRSTGEWVGFGALEKRDMIKVLDTLEQKGLGKIPVGILGVSYGASVALDFAAEDARVNTVVAIEPFSSARAGIPEMARAAFPEYASKISDRMFRSAFLIGANKGVFDWDETDTSRSVSRIHHPILLIHGGSDTWLSPDHSRRLLSQAKLGSRLIVVPDETHVSLPLGMEKIGGDVRNWFDASLLKGADQNVDTSPSDEQITKKSPAL